LYPAFRKPGHASVDLYTDGDIISVHCPQEDVADCTRVPVVVL